MDTTSLYRPLDASRREIRLITLLPCEDEEGQIACRLENASLDDGVEYAAMSYVWGDADVTTDILVNNIAFQATTNLVSGLRHFRQYGLGLPGKEDDASLPRLWVDAICINQKDTKERNLQVALMEVIYTSARYVLTWLGPCPGDDEIGKSLRLMREFSQQLPGRLKQALIDRRKNYGEKQRAADESNCDGGGQSLWQSETADVDGPETELIQNGLKWISEQAELHMREEEKRYAWAWGAFVALTDLPYWQRVWIQQERVLCRKFEANLVHCGADAAALEDLILFFTLISALKRREIIPPETYWHRWDFWTSRIKLPVLESIVKLRALWKRGVPSPDLVSSLALRCDATDPRDMVYGLRSLLNLNVDVDYDKTVREVYLDWHAAALECCRARGELEACGIHWAGRGISGDNPHDLPSWMPDLAAMHKSRFIHQDAAGTKLGPGGRFHLVGANEQQNSEDGVLSVNGVAYDIVCKSLVVLQSDDMQQILKAVAVNYLQEMKTRDHPTGLRPLRALFYAIHQGIDPDTKEPFPPRLGPTSMSAGLFRHMILSDKVSDPSNNWNHVDIGVSGTLGEYLYSQFLQDPEEDENHRWLSAVEKTSTDDLVQEMSRFLTSVRLFLENRTIFFTTDGYIGVGPRYIEVDDQLCVINNCQLPVLLRAEGSGHVLVGAMYVYGLSENEPLDMLKSGKVDLRKFEIH